MIKKKNYLKIKNKKFKFKKTLNQVDYIVLSPRNKFKKKKNLINLKKKIITDIDLFYLTNKNLKVL
jgi:UDP-N-acetylmuramoylalanine-D-glutamate ligase